ncbi:hypothetical protein K469DRAFT_36275 [Zopfia rhizophila CBS 207.26]|uniref:Zn(2)-C6 fungal-type domain-containing protein n=1 Tax=Zopfia rhizophila CBS 207.26 TaxID=1314779 RepID=A0A6A6DCL3_9PEZI|nr:hypothetical protein K469DRAFT_36275 [Zopfia rhizophila CBS 207.26]
MDSSDVVRGKKRQRKKTPKTRSGCITCKIRRIKCDEAKPSCHKCTSTGRKCDGYMPNQPDVSNAGLHAPIVQAEVPRTTTNSTNAAIMVDLDEELAGVPYEPTIQLPLFSLGFPTTLLSGRAFHYYIHRSSLDLTGPLHSQVWRSYVLSVCATSPAIQHAVVALSGFHERYCYADIRPDEECWRSYYLAVKGVNALLHTSNDEHGRGKAVKETLVACAIFITIEILLGNTDAALKHLEGGLALIRQYLTPPASPPGTPKPTRSILLRPSQASSICKQTQGAISPLPESRLQLDDRTTDLIGFFARLDLQVLTFLPSQHKETSSERSSSPTSPLRPVDRPLPNVPSASLYRIIRQSLYWIEHFATHFKYSSPIPAKVISARDSLIKALQQWHSHFQTSVRSSDPIFCPDVEVDCDVAISNLLVAYHTTCLKLISSLESTESIFDTPTCRASFQSILENAELIITSRNPYLRVGRNDEKVARFFGLENCTVEPLYYVALKCRDSKMRRRAVVLLGCAGGGGVWDGGVIAGVAEHVVMVEEDGMKDESAEGPVEWVYGEYLYQGEGGVRGDGDDEEEDETVIPEENRAHNVFLSVDGGERTVDVECAFRDGDSGWRYQNAVLKY